MAVAAVDEGLLLLAVEAVAVLMRGIVCPAVLDLFTIFINLFLKEKNSRKLHRLKKRSQVINGAVELVCRSALVSMRIRIQSLISKSCKNFTLKRLKFFSSRSAIKKFLYP